MTPAPAISFIVPDSRLWMPEMSTCMRSLMSATMIEIQMVTGWLIRPMAQNAAGIRVRPA